MKKIKLLAPAGSFDSLQAAIKAGADAVYFGLSHLNMRARSSQNFSLSDLDEILAICKSGDVLPCVTLNTIMYDQDIDHMKEICNRLKEHSVAVIASDISTITYAHSINLPVHISTQSNISNIEAVSFYSQFADVMVLARELTLEQIQYICSNIKKRNICGPSGSLVSIELFAHGALCVSISGKCYMSLAQHNASANRGLCLQPCRRKYLVKDVETDNELIIDSQYIMSPKDLCTIKFLDKIIDSGVSILKIEGRGRSPDYVYTVIKTYKDALNSISDGSYNPEKINEFEQQLKKVYNRGFWHGGYYLGDKLGEWSASYGSCATRRKELVGKVTNYYSHLQVAEFKLEAGDIKIGDEILITGSKTGVIETKVTSLRKHESEISAKKGDVITIPISEKVRRNDKLFKILPTNEL